MNGETTEEYRRRLRLADWAAIRRDRIHWTRWHCEKCGVLAYDLDLHHETYTNLGNEHPSDLRLLCKPCHRRADAERSERTEIDIFNRRLDGWACRVYGDDWRCSYSYEEMHDRFYDWLALHESGENAWGLVRSHIIDTVMARDA